MQNKNILLRVLFNILFYYLKKIVEIVRKKDKRVEQYKVSH